MGYVLGAMRLSLALALILAGCNRAEEFTGKPYSEMVESFGAPIKTTGWPAKRGSCLWLVRKEGENAYRVGGHETSDRVGYLWAEFIDGLVVRWKMKAESNEASGP